MKRPTRTWSQNYKHDRRVQRHRCRCCWKIINDGEEAILSRVGNRTTWALHSECATKRHSDLYTWGEIFAVWSGDAAEKPESAAIAKAEGRS